MTLDALRHLERADVYKGGRLAGALSRLRDGVAFACLDGYAGPPVATTLPLGMVTRTGHAGAVPAFFAGLLPEGRRLTALRVAVKTSADDDLSLLLATGRDAIGDVRVVPPDESPDAAEPPLEVSGHVRFSEVLARVLGRVPEDRVGLPGCRTRSPGG